MIVWTSDQLWEHNESLCRETRKKENVTFLLWNQDQNRAKAWQRASALLNGSHNDVDIFFFFLNRLSTHALLFLITRPLTSRHVWKFPKLKITLLHGKTRQVLAFHFQSPANNHVDRNVWRRHCWFFNFSMGLPDATDGKCLDFLSIVSIFQQISCCILFYRLACHGTLIQHARADRLSIC